MRRRTAVWITAVAVVLVAATVGTTIWAMTRPPTVAEPAGAEEAAQGYLDALAAGDADGAISLLAGEHDDDALRDAFAGAVSLPASVAVGESTGEHAFSVTYTVGEETVAATLTLEDTDAGWRVADGALAAASVEAVPAAHVTIGDAVVPVDTVVELLPAVYPVGAVPAELLNGSSELAAVPGDTQSAAVETSVSPDATQAAQAQLDRYAESCTAVADAVPERCGITVPWPADFVSLERIAYRVEQTPTVSLDTGSGAFEATGGVLVATASGQSHDGAERSFTYRSEDWSLYGDLRFEDDRLVLAVR